MNSSDSLIDRNALMASLRAARDATLEVYADLPEPLWECSQVPYLENINPPLWELGHIAWFQEYWCTRWTGNSETTTVPSLLLLNADELLDSRIVPHRARWTAQYPDRGAIFEYMQASLESVIGGIPDWEEGRIYFARLALHHEQMHAEALTMTLNALGLPLLPSQQARGAEAISGDWHVEAGCYLVGSRADETYFLFDNEKYQHPVELAAYSIGRQAVSNAEYSTFVLSGGYADARFWSADGNEWRRARKLPPHWALQGDCILETRFGQQQPLDAESPAQCLCLYEAEAYCRWSGRRLPTEAEWETAATQIPGFRSGSGLVWEWTASPFQPYPGFSPDPYREYSQPWFGNHQVLRGGSWATHPDLKRARFRNFYLPHRNDVFAGFRTCAV